MTRYFSTRILNFWAIIKQNNHSLKHLFKWLLSCGLSSNRIRWLSAYAHQQSCIPRVNTSKVGFFSTPRQSHTELQTNFSERANSTHGCLVAEPSRNAYEVARENARTDCVVPQHLRISDRHSSLTSHTIILDNAPATVCLHQDQPFTR